MTPTHMMPSVQYRQCETRKQSLSRKQSETSRLKPICHMTEAVSISLTSLSPSSHWSSQWNKYTYAQTIYKAEVSRISHGWALGPSCPALGLASAPWLSFARHWRGPCAVGSEVASEEPSSERSAAQWPQWDCCPARRPRGPRRRAPSRASGR